MPFLSVVIPIGNLSRDLANVKKICNESMGNFFEFILIVDQLRAPTIDELSELENSHTRVIHKFSGSPGISRNFGSTLAKGEYICFWDSDDEPDKEVIHKELLTNYSKFDVAVFNYTITNLDSKTRTLVEHFSNLDNCFRTPAIWRMVFRNEESIVGQFGTHMCGEDQIFLLTSGVLSGEIYFADSISYNYIIHSPDQLSRNTSSTRGIFESYFESIEILKNSTFPQDANWNIPLNLFNSIMKRFMLYSLKQKLIFIRTFPTLLNLNFLKCAAERVLGIVRDLRFPEYFALAGGLGNQLFQYSAAYNSSTRKINLVTNLFPVTKNLAGLPELSDCNIPGKINYCEHFKFSRIFRKTVNSALRVAAAKRFNLLIKFYCNLASTIASLLFLIENRSLMLIRIDANTGHTSSNGKFIRTLHIGYFQTNRFAQKLVTGMSNTPLVDIENRPDLKRLIEDSSKIQPVMVHVRLGDYETESDIGLLSREYFTSALRRLAQECSIKNVWIFSNDPEKAKEYFADFGGIDFWAVEDRGFRSADTLELMRHMHGFVIANSTFSWWGARLAYFKDLQIMSPCPWFKNLKEPNQLIPEDWLKEKAIFYEV